MLTNCLKFKAIHRNIFTHSTHDATFLLFCSHGFSLTFFFLFLCIDKRPSIWRCNQTDEIYLWLPVSVVDYFMQIINKFFYMQIIIQFVCIYRCFVVVLLNVKLFHLNSWKFARATIVSEIEDSVWKREQ